MCNQLNLLLQQQGFVIYKKNNILKDHLITSYQSEFDDFCKAWEDLPNDSYLLEGESYRQRRYAVLNYQQQKLTVLPNEPHYQTRHYNPLYGNIDRHFEAWHPSSLNNPILLQSIHWVTQQLSEVDTTLWQIQAHQFRITASINSQGKPTPEGIHKDGADYIFIMLLDRQNISGGVSEIYDNNKILLCSTQLEHKGDLILLNDNAVYHRVTEIKLKNKDRKAYRDVLVLTFHKK
jgi:hypothetical protein